MPSSAGAAPTNDPPWNAAWCWTASRLTQPWNTYAYFRRAIDLPDRPASAVVRVSADARYTLFVNGRRVHQGPARSFPHLQSFDTLDLADFLTAGLNSICAIVHKFGVPTAQSMFRDASGFLLDGIVETNAGTFPLHTPHGWLARDAAGWRKHVARLSPQLGFQEHFDADADPPDWLLPDFAATVENGWNPARSICPVAGHPWLSMQPRGIPLLADEVVSFTSILSQFSGENARGYKVAEDVFHHALQETRKKSKPAFESPDAMLRDDDHSSTLATPPDGQFHLIVLDLGVFRTGHIILDITQAAGDEIIDVLYLQELDKNNAPLLAAGDDAPADRYRCRPGAQRWEAFWPKGFRYAALIFRNIENPLQIRHVGVRSIQTAISNLGDFETSDEQLNAIYQAGAQTLQACMTDAYLDCPGVSQSQRWSEARLQFRAGAYRFGDTSLLERGIIMMAQSQSADGALHAHPPSDNPRERAVDSMFAWIGSLWEHYFHTGRTNLLSSSRPAMDRLVAFFSAHERREGLLGGFDGFELFADPAGVYPSDFSAPLNLLYLQTLRWSAGIYEVLELEPESARLSRKADILAKSIDKHFWDPKAKLWKDGYDLAANTPVDQISVHTNALAILLHLRPEARPALARDVILKAMTAKRGKTLIPSPALAACAIDALVEANLRTEAIDLIRARWGAMIERGATTFSQSWDGVSGSKCFGAAASPVSILPQQILGVAPVEIGWTRVRIAPLVGSLEFARGTIPSPRGPIRVEWEKAADDQLAVRVELPDGVEGEFVGPLGESRQLDSGVSEFHT